MWKGVFREDYRFFYFEIRLTRELLPCVYSMDILILSWCQVSSLGFKVNLVRSLMTHPLIPTFVKSIDLQSLNEVLFLIGWFLIYWNLKLDFFFQKGSSRKNLRFLRFEYIDKLKSLCWDKWLLRRKQMSRLIHAKKHNENHVQWAAQRPDSIKSNH